MLYHHQIGPANSVECKEQLQNANSGPHSNGNFEEFLACFAFNDRFITNDVSYFKVVIQVYDEHDNFQCLVDAGDGEHERHCTIGGLIKVYTLSISKYRVPPVTGYQIIN